MILRKNKSLELFDDLIPSANYSKQNIRYSNIFGQNCLEKFYKKIKHSSDSQTKITFKEIFNEKFLKYQHKPKYKKFILDQYLKSKKEEDKKEEMKLALRKKKIHLYINERTIENVQRIKDRIEKFKNETPFCKYNPKYEYINKRIPNVYIIPEHISHSISKMNSLNNSNENILTGKTRNKQECSKYTNENNCIRLKKIKHNTSHLPNSLRQYKEMNYKLNDNNMIINKKLLESNVIHKSGSLPIITTLHKEKGLSFRKQSINCSNSINKIQLISIDNKIMTPVTKKSINFYI